MNKAFMQTRYLVSETDPHQLREAKAEVAFIGRSNVGKSTFLNALCDKNGLAKVSKTPGRTRMINVFGIDAQHWLVDLPGYGYAAGSKTSREGWPEMIETYLTSRPSLRCIFLLIDSKVGPTKLDFQMIDWLNAHSLPFRLVANKLDQVKPSQRFGHQKAITQALGQPLTWVSAKEGTGIPALQQVVLKLLEDPPEG